MTCRAGNGSALPALQRVAERGETGWPRSSCRHRVHKLAFGVRDTVVTIRSGSGVAPGSRLYARCLYVSMYRAHNLSPCRSIGSKPPSWSGLGSRREAPGCDSDELWNAQCPGQPDSPQVGHVVVRHGTPKSFRSGGRRSTNSCAKFTMQWGPAGACPSEPKVSEPLLHCCGLQSAAFPCGDALIRLASTGSKNSRCQSYDSNASPAQSYDAIHVLCLRW